MNELQNENQVVEEITEAPEKQSFGASIKKSFKNKKFKNGAYATTISAVVVALILVLNLFASEFNLKVDLSSEKMYTLTEETKELVKNLQEDVTIYYLAQAGSEMPMYKEIVDKYEGLSKKVHIEQKDPVLYPKFAAKYTENEISNNSVLVINKKTDRAKYIDNYDMVQSTMDYSTMQPQITGFDVEGQVSSAIQYVTTEDLPVMYAITGHGEAEMAQALTSMLKKQNVTVNSLETLTTQSIPKDCSMLVINAPTNDYTEDELTMIKEYLTNSGNAIIIADYASSSLTNFNKLLEYYGIGLVSGMVMEKDQNHMMGQYPNMTIPDINYHDITKSIKEKKMNIVVPNTIGIKELETKRSTLKIKPLLTTSDSAYCKVNDMTQTLEKEDGDIDGPFNVCVAIEDKYHDQESKIVVFGSSQMFGQQISSLTGLANTDLFAKSVNYMSKEGNTLAIRTVTGGVVPLTMTAAQSNFWLRIVLIIVPAVVIIIGVIVCVRRRKK